jgi:hypothetical protein
MWRAVFFAVSLSACISGAVTLAVSDGGDDGRPRTDGGLDAKDANADGTLGDGGHEDGDTHDGPSDAPPCTLCKESEAGNVCMDGGCGCNQATDCPELNACSASTHQCTSTCSPDSPCNEGCCDKISDEDAGTCKKSGIATSCGSGNQWCFTCGYDASLGPRCVPGEAGGPARCGCYSIEDASMAVRQANANSGCSDSCDSRGRKCSGSAAATCSSTTAGTCEECCYPK